MPNVTHTTFQARATGNSMFPPAPLAKSRYGGSIWKADATFASFYLRDLSPALINPTLGPLVVAQAAMDILQS